MEKEKIQDFPFNDYQIALCHDSSLALFNV